MKLIQSVKSEGKNPYEIIILKSKNVIALMFLFPNNNLQSCGSKKYLKNK